MKRIVCLILVSCLLCFPMLGCKEVPEKKPYDSVTLSEEELEWFFDFRTPTPGSGVIKIYAQENIEIRFQRGDTVQDLIDEGESGLRFYIYNLLDRAGRGEKKDPNNECGEGLDLTDWQKKWFCTYARNPKIVFGEDVNIINTYCFAGWEIRNNFNYEYMQVCIYFVTDIGNYFLYGIAPDGGGGTYLIPEKDFYYMSENRSADFIGGWYLEDVFDLTPYWISALPHEIEVKRDFYEEPIFWLGIGIGAAGVAISGAILTVAAVIVKKKSKKKAEISAE